MMHVIIKEKLYDEAYVTSRTVGLDDLKKMVEKYTPEVVEGITGIPKDQLDRRPPVSMLPQRQPPSSMPWASPSTSPEPTTSSPSRTWPCFAAMWAIEGGGVNPLRGQNNVQGACDMGALPNVYTGYRRVTDLAVRRDHGQGLGRGQAARQERAHGHGDDGSRA